MLNIFEIFFWMGIVALIYAYLGYPLFLLSLNKLFYSKPLSDKKTIIRWPTVSILIAAYNEEKVINGRIQNCLEVDYPAGLLDIWIASDGSSDNTNEIVKSYAKKDKKIHLLEFPRTGKSRVLNKAISYVKSEIVVFSDANTEFESAALKNLISHFFDPDIGCVCGRLVYRNPDGIISGKGESLYWRFETVLKKIESKLGYVAGANGAIYAIRRELFKPLPPKTINDDFMTSMQIVKKGFKCIYEENAIAYENVALTMKSEFNRHVRDSAGHYIAVCHLLGLLNPFLGVRSFIYWSHRMLRWLAPFMLIFLFFSNIILLNNIFYKNLLFLQVGFYLLSVIGLVSIKSIRLPFFVYVPFYFCNLNLALLLGFFKAFTGKQKTTWERTERME